MVGLHYDVQPKITRGNIHVRPVGGKTCLQQGMSSSDISVISALMDVAMKTHVAGIINRQQMEMTNEKQKRSFYQR